MRTILGCLLLIASTTLADPRDRFVEEGTFLVATIDVDTILEPDVTKRLLRTIDVLQPYAGDEVLLPSEKAPIGYEYIAMEIRRSGIRRAFVTAAVDDIRIGYAPLVVCDLKEESDPQPLIKRIQRDKRFDAGLVDGQLWISTPKSLKRYRDLKTTPRTDLLQPLVAASSDSTLAVIVSPGSDARRVLRELWPSLPAPFDKLTGPLVADGMERIEMTAKLDDNTSGRVALVASDEATRGRFAELADVGLHQGIAWVRENQSDYAELAKQAVGVLAPTAEGTTLAINLSGTSPAVQEMVAKVIAPAAQKAREAARAKSKQTQMKQLALALLNYESAINQLPAIGAIIDADEKPLLSWRVAILPFLQESKLYEQFHFDEPWNSEHNLRVAAEMPEVFGNPSHPELAAEGMTTYQRTIYPGSDLAAERDDAELYEHWVDKQKARFAPGDKYRQISDGTSKTLMIAEVAPEHAVFWTKPDDWQVDLEDPMAKLKTDQREGFVSAFYDGHAKYIPFDYSPSGLKKLLTKAGGEVLSEDERP